MHSPDERVPIGEVADLIQVGVPLPFRVLDAHERLLLNEGQHISTDRLLNTLIERGAWVERHLVQEHRARAAAGGGQGKPGSLTRLFTLFDRWDRAQWDLDALLRGTLRKEATAAQWRAMVTELLALLDKDGDVALFSAVRQEDRRFALYPLAHALHSAVLAALTVRQAGWPDDRQRSVVGAALSR
jgi:hypothetical protein